MPTTGGGVNIPDTKIYSNESVILKNVYIFEIVDDIQYNSYILFGKNNECYNIKINAHKELFKQNILSTSSFNINNIEKEFWGNSVICYDKNKLQNIHMKYVHKVVYI